MADAGPSARIREESTAALNSCVQSVQRREHNSVVPGQERQLTLLSGTDQVAP